MCVNSYKLISWALPSERWLFLLILKHNLWSYFLSLSLCWPLPLPELQLKFGQKKEVNFQVLVPVKVLFSIKTTRLVAIAENCLRNRIVEQIHSTTNPIFSISMWRMLNLSFKKHKLRIKKLLMNFLIIIGAISIIFSWKKPEIRIWRKKFRLSHSQEPLIVSPLSTINSSSKHGS